MSSQMKIGIMSAMLLGAMSYRNADPEQSVGTTQGDTATTDPVPSEHPVATAIKAQFDNKVDVIDAKFHFKKKKDETSGVESKRPSLELKLPRPSVEGIVEILTGGNQKQLDLLLEAVSNIILDRAREVINSDVNEALTQENFPISELSWEAIANQPAAERRGGGIAKELWDEFFADYEAVMPAVTSKPLDSIKRATKVYATKFNLVKTDKPVLKLLRGQLALYLNNTPNAELFMECVTFLDKKAETLINAESSSLLEAL